MVGGKKAPKIYNRVVSLSPGPPSLRLRILGAGRQAYGQLQLTSAHQGSSNRDERR